MNTPLTPGMSALLCIPEDGLDHHEYIPLPQEFDNNYDHSQAQSHDFNFDNSNNFTVEPATIENRPYFQHDFGADQVPSNSLYGSPTAVRTAPGEMDEQPFDAYMTSRFQPSSTSQSPFHDRISRNNSVPAGLSNNEYANPVSAQAYHVFQDATAYPVLRSNHRQPLGGESSFVPNMSHNGVNITSEEIHPPPKLAPQTQLHYDSYGNVISPLQVMNDQYEMQMAQNAYMQAGLNPAYLIPPATLPNTTQHNLPISTSLSPSNRRQDNLLPPPSLPPAPPPNPGDPPVKVKRRRRRKPPPPPEVAAAKHKAFLQRNREAASKCRTKKKRQIHELEDEERMGRQINTVLKDEIKEIMGEVMLLREQIQEMPCEEDGEGCGEHAPMRRDSVVMTSSVDSISAGIGDGEEHSDEDGYDDKSDVEQEQSVSGSASLHSPLSVDDRFQNFSFDNDTVTVQTVPRTHEAEQEWKKRRRDDATTASFHDEYAGYGNHPAGRRQSSAYLEGYDRLQAGQIDV